MVIQSFLLVILYGFFVGVVMVHLSLNYLSGFVMILLQFLVSVHFQLPFVVPLLLRIYVFEIVILIVILGAIFFLELVYHFFGVLHVILLLILVFNVPLF